MRIARIVPLLALFSLVLAQPASAVALSPGDIVVSDLGADAVFQVHPGTGAQATVSSGGNLIAPFGVSMDPHGRVLVPDFGFCDPGIPTMCEPGGVIRVEPSTGAQTVLTSGQFRGVAVEASGQIVTVGQEGVIRVNPSSGAQTVLSSGENLVVPFGVAVEASGQILVADIDCCGGPGGIIRVNPSTGAQTVVASGGNFVDPSGLAVEASGKILVVDPDCCGGNLGGVIRVDPATGAQTVLSSGGNFFGPFAVAVGTSGEILVADQNSGVIRVDPSTGAQSVVSSGGSFSVPSGIDSVTPGIDELIADAGGTVTSGGNARVSGGITCQAPERWTVAVTVSQPSTGARGTARDSGECDGDEQAWSGVARHGSGPAFAPGNVKVAVTARLLMAGELRDKAAVRGSVAIA